MNIEQRIRDLEERTRELVKKIEVSGEIHPSTEILIRSLEQAIDQMNEVCEEDSQ